MRNALEVDLNTGPWTVITMRLILTAALGHLRDNESMTVVKVLSDCTQLCGKVLNFTPDPHPAQPRRDTWFLVLDLPD